MIHCVVIVSNSDLQKRITSYCNEIQFLQLESSFVNFESAKSVLRTSEINLLFLDSEIDNETGFEFYQHNKNKAVAIFLGSNKRDAFEAFSCDAVDFLDTDFTFKRFIQAINKAKNVITYERYLSKFEDNFLHIRSEYKLVKVPFSEINYFETLDDYIKVHLLGKKPILTLMSMKTLQSKLPSEKFIRVHRSFVVPIHKIISVRGKVIDLGFTEIPIGKSFESDFYKLYLKEGF